MELLKDQPLMRVVKRVDIRCPIPMPQADLIQEALTKAKIDPTTISYIEAHGTGTSLGDPIEIAGLAKAFGKNVPKMSCAIGSVKSNIGHLEGAAGIAAITKVLLQLKHKHLVPSINAETVNPYIDFENTPFFVQSGIQKWNPKQGYPRRAGISSFGAGGSNAHIIVEEGPEYILSQHQTKPYYLISLSAKHPYSLKQRLDDLHDFFIINPDLPLEAIAYTLNVGRSHFEHRCALVVSSLEELQEKIEKVRKAQKITGYFQGDTRQESE